MRVVGQRRAKLEDQAKTVKPVGVRPRAAQEPKRASGLVDLQQRGWQPCRRQPPPQRWRGQRPTGAAPAHPQSQ